MATLSPWPTRWKNIQESGLNDMPAGAFVTLTNAISWLGLAISAPTLQDSCSSTNSLLYVFSTYSIVQLQSYKARLWRFLVHERKNTLGGNIRRNNTDFCQNWQAYANQAKLGTNNVLANARQLQRWFKYRDLHTHYARESIKQGRFVAPHWILKKLWIRTSATFCPRQAILDARK